MDDDVTTLWDDRYSPAQIAAFQQLFAADPELASLQVLTHDGKELTMFRGQHPVGLGPAAEITPAPEPVFSPTPAERRQAKASNALSDRVPSGFGLSVLERWIGGEQTTQQAVDTIKAHYRTNPVAEYQSDLHAPQNLLGITDSRQLHRFEADVTTLRMAELAVGRQGGDIIRAIASSTPDLDALARLAKSRRKPQGTP
jgi:hypothetical protein